MPLDCGWPSEAAERTKPESEADGGLWRSGSVSLGGRIPSFLKN
ncbi:hypothetical protein B8V81_1459 [Paenibacillus pasadenensis]|uniref:Uncharacterized protein n=1 Tax=Paenibacillus pasadenensis TaxID=217090 RepID=A0A2N5NA89_9BACL|nr:hypothetical protein B8V81_1459 [Paenibacillus pasadenensis]